MDIKSSKAMDPAALKALYSHPLPEKTKSRGTSGVRDQVTLSKQSKEQPQPKKAAEAPKSTAQAPPKAKPIPKNPIQAMILKAYTGLDDSVEEPHLINYTA